MPPRGGNFKPAASPGRVSNANNGSNWPAGRGTDTDPVVSSHGGTGRAPVPMLSQQEQQRRQQQQQQRQASQSKPQNVSQQQPSRPNARKSPKPDPIPGAPLYQMNYLNPRRRLTYYHSNNTNVTALVQLALNSSIGFDIEWRPNFVAGRPSNPVALVQLAGEHDVVLIQISSYQEPPELLKNILQNEAILKVGVGIHEDVEKLEKDTQMQVRNVLDLSPVARNLDPYWNAATAKSQEEAKLRKISRDQPAEQSRSQGQPHGEDQTRRQLQGHTQDQIQGQASATVKQNIVPTTDINPATRQNLQNGTKMNRAQRRKVYKKNDETEKFFGPPKALSIGLTRLVARYLSLNLVKPKSVSTSNWEKVPLTDRELTYAANDAAAGYDIYQALERIQRGEAQLPTVEA